MRYCQDYVVTQEDKDDSFVFRIYRKTEEGYILVGKNNDSPMGIEEYANKDMEKRFGRNWKSKILKDQSED